MLDKMKSNKYIIHLVQNNRFLKILCIITFIFIILALTVTAITPPSTGYELSIYSAYPWYFWIFLIGGIISATLILLREVFNEEKTKLWILGLLGILTVNFLFLLLPLFRGYPFSGGADADIFTHIGLTRDIAQSGHIYEDNFYPVIHIFTVTLSDVLGVSINRILWFVPVFFSTLYVLFVLLLAKATSVNKKQALLITAFSTPLIFSGFHLSISPSFFSFIFLPLLLYLYHERYLSKRKIELTGLIIIICFFIVFFHPITTLIAIVIFFTFIGVYFLLKKMKTVFHYDVTITNQQKTSNIVLILIVSFFSWYTSSREGLSNIGEIYQSLILRSEWVISEQYISVLGIANLTIFQTIQLFILRYGVLIIYSIIAFFCFIIIGKKLVFSRKINENEFSYSLQLVSAFFIALVFLTGYFIIFDPIRCLEYFLMIATIFNGIVLYSLMEKSKRHGRVFLKKILLSTLITVIILFSSIVCIFNVYQSPIIWQPNRQVTHMSFAGSAWIVENRDTNIQVAQDYSFNLLRMEHYINGIQNGYRRIKMETLYIPTHFGYNDTNTIYQVMSNINTYMITTENGRQAVNAFPENIQPKVHQFTSYDFNRLSSDITVNKIFENGEFECWLASS